MANKVAKAKLAKKTIKLPRLNPRNFVFALVGILVFSVVGAYGTQYVNNRQLSAKAAGWTNTYAWCGSKGCVYAKVCKTAQTGGYGPVWRLKHYVQNSSSDSVSSYFRTKRGSSIVATSSVNSSAYISKAGADIYASRVLNDTFESRIVGYQGGRYIDSGYVWMPIDSIASC